MNDAYRRLAAVVGVLCLLGGLVVVSGARGGDVPTAAEALSIAGGVLALWTAVLVHRDWIPTGRVETPAVERRTDFPAPGDDFDETLSQFDGSGRGVLPERNAIHERLRDLAVMILSRRQEHTHESAVTAVRSGEWPDDPAVSAFLRNPDARLPRTWTDRLRGILGVDSELSDFQELTRRTVDALAERSDLVDVDDDSVVVSGPEIADRRRNAAPRWDVGGRASADAEAGAVLDVVTTGRWRAAVPAGLAFVGVGFALGRAALVLAGVVAVGFAVYARASAPSSARLSVVRSFEDDHPDPGDEVEVTTVVTNDGDGVVPDLRIVDGVPPGLAVSEGSPRYGTALRPGESVSFTYSVTARRGRHEFGPATAIVRDLAGTTARVTLAPVADGSDGGFSCVPQLGGLPLSVPLYEQSGQYLGRIPADGGEGIEFHATREYRPGDSSTRIDWKRLARSGSDELTTVQFREERAAAVTLVVDAYSTAYLAPDADDPGSVERSVEAAGRLFGSLLAAGDRVGLAALGPTPLWVDQGTGLEHRTRVEETLATHPALPPTAPTDDDVPLYWARDFHRRYPAESQVVLLSPFCDFRYRFVIHRLRAYGHPVTIISPDPTVDGTVGRRLVSVERRHHIEAMREAGTRVIDWDPGDELAVALGRAGERWSR